MLMPIELEIKNLISTVSKNEKKNNLSLFKAQKKMESQLSKIKGYLKEVKLLPAKPNTTDVVDWCIR